MLTSLDVYGEVFTEFYLHFEWKKSSEEKLTDIRNLFAKLLRKSSSIANPLQFFKYTSSFSEFEDGPHAFTNKLKIARV